MARGPRVQGLVLNSTWVDAGERLVLEGGQRHPVAAVPWEACHAPLQRGGSAMSFERHRIERDVTVALPALAGVPVCCGLWRVEALTRLVAGSTLAGDCSVVVEQGQASSCDLLCFMQALERLTVLQLHADALSAVS